jgi:ubiquinone/menaquinone biosynthesis C-methylase UbiE
MSASDHQGKARLSSIFDRASATYGQVGPGYFAYFGERLVERAGLAPGMRVLDVACGRGAVLFPAAQRVGETGSVVGIDLSPGMVAATSAEIAERGISNATVQVMDGEQLSFPDATFDALTCAFSIFFMSESAALAEFHRVLRPGGRIAISTWEPAGQSPNEAARWAWYDDLLKRYLPADPAAPASANSAQMQTQEQLADRVAHAGFEEVVVQSDAATFTYASPEEWWQVRWSLVFRGALEALPPQTLAQMQAEALTHAAQMQARGQLITELTALFTLARAPQA